MEEFFYEARDSATGNLIKGCFKAKCQADVVSYLKREQYLIISINHRDFTSLKQHFLQRLQTGRINTKQIILLCRQLSVMLEAGISIIDAISVLNDNCTNKYMQKFLAQTATKLKEGNSLTFIWRQQTDIIPAYLLNSLNAAENTGMLPEALSRSADFLEKSYEERRKIRQICIYPACLLLLLFAIANIMILFVLPAFADIFRRMNLTLPFITQCIFSGGLFLKTHYIEVLFSILMVLLILKKLWQRKAVKYKFYENLFKLPLIGNFWRNILLLQINRQLEFLIGSGIDIDESLSIIVNGLGSDYLHKMLKSVQYNLRQGFSFYASLKNTPLHDSIFAQLINIGEQTGMLKETLHYSNLFLSREVDNFIIEFTKFLEPALMIIIGTVVGIFVAAIILPLFEMSGGIGL